MRRGLTMVLAIVVVTLPTTVHAGSKEIIQPIQLGNEAVRYDRGEYLLDLPGQRAAVQIRPMPSDHGNLSFLVVVLNTSTQPFNIDIGSIRVEGTSEPVRLLSKAEMVQKAESRAFWAKLGTALAAGQRDYYSGTITGPYGGWASVEVSGPCRSCQEAAAVNLARIQGYLDETGRALGNQMLQVSTVDPGRGYAGRIFLTRFNRKPMSQMRLVVSIGGEDFAFGFRFATAGTPMPSFRTIVAAPVTVPPAALLTTTPQPLVQTRLVSAPATASPVTARAPAAALQPMAATLNAGGNLETRRKWRSYYSSLVAMGVGSNKAKAMANEEFGAID